METCSSNIEIVVISLAHVAVSHLANPVHILLSDRILFSTSLFARCFLRILTFFKSSSIATSSKKGPLKRTLGRLPSLVSRAHSRGLFCQTMSSRPSGTVCLVRCASQSSANKRGIFQFVAYCLMKLIVSSSS